MPLFGLTTDVEIVISVLSWCALSYLRYASCFLSMRIVQVEKAVHVATSKAQVDSSVLRGMLNQQIVAEERI